MGAAFFGSRRKFRQDKKRQTVEELSGNSTRK